MNTVLFHINAVVINHVISVYNYEIITDIIDEQ